MIRKNMNLELFKEKIVTLGFNSSDFSKSDPAFALKLLFDFFHKETNFIFEEKKIETAITKIEEIEVALGVEIDKTQLQAQLNSKRDFISLGFLHANLDKIKIEVFAQIGVSFSNEAAYIDQHFIYEYIVLFNAIHGTSYNEGRLFHSHYDTSLSLLKSKDLLNYTNIRGVSYIKLKTRNSQLVSKIVVKLSLFPLDKNDFLTYLNARHSEHLGHRGLDRTIFTLIKKVEDLDSSFSGKLLFPTPAN